MTAINDWLSLLRSRTAEAKGLWLTQAQFEAVIDELLDDPASPIAGLQYSLEFDEPFHSVQIGRPGSGDAEVRSGQLNDNRGGKCRVLWWPRASDNLAASLDHSALFDFVNAWWKPTLRTVSAGLPDLKRDAEATAIANRTVAQQLASQRRPAVLCCDLDNFKQVNETFTHQGGNRVIKEFGALAETAVAPFGVLLHNGGDELVVLCPDGGAVAAIRAAYAVRHRLSRHDFKIDSLSVGMSAGIAATDSPQRLATFQELEVEADRALDEYAKKPTKGCARFNPDGNEVASELDGWSLADRAALGRCIAVSAAGIASPFGSAWLNALSAVVTDEINGSGLGFGAVADVARDFISWMKVVDGPAPMPVGRPPKFSYNSIGVNPKATALDLAFAIAHGVCSAREARSGLNLNVSYSEDGTSASLTIRDTSVLLWHSSPDIEFTRHCELHLVPRSTEAPTGARAILIKVGHQPLPVPAQLFAEVIVVDDRPTLGGCLPDFWEVTIARLVARLQANPNVGLVFVVGEHRNAAETISRLRDLDQWKEGSEDMAHRLAVTTATLRSAADRLTGHIHFPLSYDELVRTLAEAVDHTPLQSTWQAVRPASPPILNRQLKLADMALSESDGFRVETPFEAFPTMLEIMRNSDAPLIRDQAGQMLKELVDFKVHLSKPTYKKIPEYYREQEVRMRQYFDSAFVDNERFFGKALSTDSQQDRVIEHVVKVIQEGAEAFATRRAILVVPNSSGSGDDLTPLGLVSVRLIPRFTAQQCQLSFSFTWRTVEALVGFPYSLYGSVRYAEHLTHLVSEQLPVSMRASVSMNYVSYLAHSLHMFVDEFGQTIVRRIVNDASR